MQSALSLFVLVSLVVSVSFAGTTWTPTTTLSVGVPTGAPEGYINKRDAEETLVGVDLNHDENTGFIQIYIKRNVMAGSQGKSIWILPDAPGDSGARVDHLVGVFKNMTTIAYDLYRVDYRGTGRSSVVLNCTLAEDDKIGACVNETVERFGDVLPFYSVSSIATDIIQAMESVTSGSADRILYASGFGTYVANRILQINPDIVKAVIMDGVIAGGNKYSDLDASMSATGRRFSQLCMEDEKCASLVGPDPYGAMEDFFENLNTQPCIQQFGGLVTPRILRENFFQLLKNPISRPAVFPILYRIRRCSEDDLSRITQVVQKLFFGSPVAPPSAPYLTSIEYSSVLNNHISVSEMWADNNSSALSRQQIEERVASTPFGGYRKFELSTLYPTWPRYSLDDYHGKYANTTVPVLLLAAELDVDAPINWAEQAASQGFNKPNQRLIKIPYGSHNTLLNTPVTNSDKTCGFQLIKQFIDSGATSGMYSPVSINTECTTKVEVVDFAGTTTAVRDYATEFVGSPDIWGVGAPVQEPTNAAVQTTSTYYFFLLSVVAVLVLYLIN